MRIRVEFAIYRVRDYEGAGHKSAESMRKLNEARALLKKPCRVCGKVVGKGRRVYCSEACRFEGERTRKH